MLGIDVEGSNRRTLAPMRAAQLDREERVVRIDTADLHETDLPTIAGAAADEEVRSDEGRISREPDERHDTR